MTSLLSPITDPSNPDTHVLPLLKSHEQSIKDSQPSFLQSPNTNAPSSLFSDYLKTGCTMLKSAAGAAFDDLMKPFSSNITVTNNQPQDKPVDIPSRQAQYKPSELDTIGGILYGELSNRGTDADQMNEAHKILDTAINRAKATKQTLGQVMTQPNQYQAYKGPQYWMYQIGTKQGGLDAPSQAKAALVQKVLQNLATPAFAQSEAGNDYFYAHNSNGEIVLRNGELFKKDIKQ